jgi:ribonuclease T2
VRRAALAFGLLAVVSGAATAQEPGEPGDFDFYVLALSWSPTWCATSPDANGLAQCDGDFGFILHGLWPQYEDGYPAFCDSSERPRRSETAAILDIAPDEGLVAHTWRKHGTCSGLSPREYLQTASSAFNGIRIPSVFVDIAKDSRASAYDVENAFIAENPGLARQGIAIACSDGWLEEVRICLTRDLAFRNCAEVDRRGCRQRGLQLPAPQ